MCDYARVINFRIIIIIIIRSPQLLYVFIYFCYALCHQVEADDDEQQHVTFDDKSNIVVNGRDMSDDLQVNIVYRSI